MSDGSTSASVDLWIDIFSPTSGPRVAGPGLRSPIKSDYEPDKILTFPPQIRACSLRKSSFATFLALFALPLRFARNSLSLNYDA